LNSVNISAIVITFNSLTHIHQSLSALQREINSVGGEIIIFDNDSTDETVAYIRSNFPGLNIIESKKNIGFGRAVNRAGQTACGEYLFLANPDMILDEGSLDQLRKTFDRFTDAAAVSGRMRNRDGAFQATCRVLPTMYNMMLSRGSWFSKFFESGKYTLGDFKEITSVPAVAGTCLMIKRDSFEMVGRFDERFFMFMEDTDLSLRINQAGSTIYFNPLAGAH